MILTASGGHNEIYLINQNHKDTKIENHKLPRLEDFEITKLGQTLDDAAGECFDKVARMLG